MAEAFSSGPSLSQSMHIKLFKVWKSNFLVKLMFLLAAYSQQITHKEFFVQNEVLEGSHNLVSPTCFRVKEPENHLL